MPGPGIPSLRAVSRISPSRFALLFAGPVAIALGSWIYLAMMIGDMSKIPGMSSMMMNPQMLDPVQFFGLFVMWTVMMAAMMLPTAAPMVVTYARMRAPDADRRSARLSVLMFAGGYVAAWAGFSLAAAVLQAGLTGLSYLSPMMMRVDTRPLAGAVFVVAGVYQFLPLKHACLRQCRTPIGFLMTQWREGRWGALSMGWRHGLFCVGCCWALMGLLFVAGVMNAVWILAITLYVLAEKIVPHGHIMTRLVGIGLIVVGAWTVFA